MINFNDLTVFLCMYAKKGICGCKMTREFRSLAGSFFFAQQLSVCKKKKLLSETLKGITRSRPFALNSATAHTLYIEHLSKHLFDIDSCSCIKVVVSPSFPFLFFHFF